MQTETGNFLREIRFTPEFKRNLRQLSNPKCWNNAIKVISDKQIPR